MKHSRRHQSWQADRSQSGGTAGQGQQHSCRKIHFFEVSSWEGKTKKLEMWHREVFLQTLTRPGQSALALPPVVSCPRCRDAACRWCWWWRPAAWPLVTAAMWIQLHGIYSLSPAVTWMQNLVHHFPTRKTWGIWNEGDFLLLRKILQCTWALWAGFNLCKRAPGAGRSFKFIKTSAAKGAESLNFTGRGGSAHVCWWLYTHCCLDLLGSLVSLSLWLAINQQHAETVLELCKVCELLCWGRLLSRVLLFLIAVSGGYCSANKHQQWQGHAWHWFAARWTHGS